MTMNQTVLITGGTKRIGLAITQCLHKNGYNVIVSFNKSHAVSYAICAYWSAYAKTHFPLEFYCNYLIHSSGKPDPQQEVKELVNDAKNNEIYISAPSIKTLNTLTDIIDGQIHFGLLSVKSVGMKQIDKFKAVISGAEI